MAVGLSVALGAGALLGREYTDDRAKRVALAAAGVGLAGGYALILFELVAPLGMLLMFSGVAAFVAWCVQSSQPMPDPEPIRLPDAEAVSTDRTRVA